MDSKTYTLKKPVKYGDKTVTQVTLSEPKMKHLKGINLTSGDPDQLLKLAGKISDQPSQVFDEMSWDDGFAVVEMINDFLPQSLKTGPTL